jgi:uncharacterized protein YkwD
MHRAVVAAALLALTPLATSAAEGGWTAVRFDRPQPPRSEPAAAQALAADVNAARAARGLPALILDERLSRFALTLARQMAQRGYFGHTDPDGVTFVDRLRSAGFVDRYAAENIALDTDEPHANLALLHSPGHYANIMDPRPHTLGVAAVVAADDEIFFVEEFGG